MRRVGQGRHRHEGERAAARVEFGRERAVGPPMPQQRGQRNLRIGPFASLDAGGFSRGRGMAVGRDDEARVDRRAVIERGADVIGREIVGRDHGVASREIGGPVRDCGERMDEIVVRNILAEGVEADIGGLEDRRRRREDRARVVDDAERADRGGTAGQCVGKTERVEREQRSFEQRNRAAVQRRRLLSDQNHLASRSRKGDGRHQAGRAGARDEDVGGLTAHAHAPGRVGHSIRTAPSATFRKACG